MKNSIKLIIVLGVIVFIASCKKDASDPLPESTTQSLTLRMTPRVGDDTLDFTSSFITDNNERYTLSMFRYYMSNIRLVKNDGSEYAITDKIFLVNPSVSDYPLGNVPVGDYKGIRFTVGLDATTNHLDPTAYPITNPLAIQSPGMHWSWNSGYIFLMMEGSCDTTALNDDVLTYGQYSKSMFYHIGMDALATSVDIHNEAFTVSSANQKILNIHSDVNELFTGVNLKTENQSHTMGSMPLATKVAGNINSMFSIIE
jgi:hypothetical protein